MQSLFLEESPDSFLFPSLLLPSHAGARTYQGKATWRHSKGVAVYKARGKLSPETSLFKLCPWLVTSEPENLSFYWGSHLVYGIFKEQPEHTKAFIVSNFPPSILFWFYFILLSFTPLIFFSSISPIIISLLRFVFIPCAFLVAQQ